MLEEEIKAKILEWKDAKKHNYFSNAAVSCAHSDDKISINLELAYPHKHQVPYLCDEVKKLFSTSAQAPQIDFSFNTRILPHNSNQSVPLLKNVKNIIVVASGKGGVGKSTVALNVALGLQASGAQVGLLDADIYGPSIPHLLGLTGSRPQIENKKFIPLEKFNLQTMSIGFLVEENAAMVWRGPMLGKAMQQLIYDTAWQALDYLIIDLPPGTGDIQLSLCQKMPLSGALVVTTPQDIALLDVRRACEMFKKMNVPILGFVENMSYHTCTHCGHEEHIFGSGGGAQLAKDYQLPLLGKIPLQLKLRQLSDLGHSIFMDKDAELLPLFQDLAEQMAARLSLEKPYYGHKFPPVIVRND